MAQPRGQWRQFRGSVKMDEFCVGKRCDGAPDHFCGDRRRAMRHCAHAGNITRIGVLFLSQSGDHDRHAEGLGGALARELVQYICRAERRDHQLTAAAPNAGDDGIRPGGVEQWRHHDRDIFRRRLGDAGPIVAIGDQISVAQHHALGSARGATRIKQSG